MGDQSNRNIIPFQFDIHQIRAVRTASDEFFFVGKDICAVLDLKDVNRATNPLDPDEKTTIKVQTIGGEQSMLAVSESGLYALILRSNKPQAKPFRKWVTSEVLPAIRRTGKYSSPFRKKRKYDPELTELARKIIDEKR